MARVMNPDVTPHFITRVQKAQARIEVIRNGLWDIYYKLEEAVFMGPRNAEDAGKALDQAEATWGLLFHHIEDASDLLAGLDSISYSYAVGEKRGQELRKGLKTLADRGNHGSVAFVEEVLKNDGPEAAMKELAKCTALFEPPGEEGTMQKT